MASKNGPFIEGEQRMESWGTWRLRENYACPHEFGATGDGVADDTAAVQAAAATGKHVDLRGGLFKITDTITLIQSMFGGTLIKGANIDMVDMSAGFCVLEDVVLLGEGATFTGRGVILTSASDGFQRIRHCLFSDMNGYCIEFTTNGAGGVEFICEDTLLQRTTSTNYAVGFPNDGSAEATTVGPRRFINVVGGGGALYDLRKSHFTIIEGGNSFDGILFTDDTKKVIINNHRIARSATAQEIKGDAHRINTCLVSVGLTVAAGATNVTLANNVLQGGTFTVNAAATNGIRIIAPDGPVVDNSTVATLYVAGPVSAIDGQWALFDSTTGKIIRAGRRVLAAPLTIYFREGGDGTGLGLIKGATAWGAIQDAIDWVDDNVHTNGYDVTFAWDDTATQPDTFTEGSGVDVIVLTAPMVGGGARIFQGHASVEDGVRIVPTGTGKCVFLSGQNVGSVRFTQNWWLSSTGAIAMELRAPCEVSNEGTMTITTDTTAIQLSQHSSYFANDGTIKLDGDFDMGFRVDSGTFHDNSSIELIGTPVITTALYRGDFFSQGYLGSDVTGAYTGSRVDLRMHAALTLFGEPGTGSARGSAQPGTSLIRDGTNENEMVGEATFASATSVAVDFTTAGYVDQFDDNYMVTVGGGVETKTYAVTPSNRSTTGFTITSSASSTDTVWWRMHWLP